jgi:glycogen synthase kinase 3 beta
MLGKGAFGVVYCAKAPNGSVVAIKKVPHDPKYKNRERGILKMLHHPNCVSYQGSFKSPGKGPQEMFLNIVMEFLPSTLHSYTMRYRHTHQYPPLFYVKLFSFQMFSGLAYLHDLGVTHRDLKPENILIDPDLAIVKICDFGSAKVLRPNEASTAYIASRYYRAPELIMGCSYYSSAVDIWAAGCVIAEMLLGGNPLFDGRSALDQLATIVRILGPPTESDLASFARSPTVRATGSQVRSLHFTLPRHTPEDLLSLLESILVYNPSKRPSAREILHHKCYDELFRPGRTLPNGRPIPPLDRGNGAA